MATTDTATAMRDDPRIQQIMQQRQSGALPSDVLQQLGYDVPDGYHFVWGGRAGYGQLADNQRSFVEKLVPLAAITMGAIAGAGALGAVPGIGGAGSAAGSVAGSGSLLTPTATVAKQEMLRLLGGAASSAADGMAANRGTQFSADAQRALLQQQSGRDFYDQSIRREQAGRDKSNNAWEMMNRASSVVNAPANLNKTMLSPYSKALAGPDQFVREQAAKFGNRSAIELDEGDTIEAPQRVGNDVELEDASGWEKAMGIGATAAGVAQAIPGGFWPVGRWIR